jgi:hypothetical protein
MREITLTEKQVLLYRVIFAGLSWFVLISGPIINWSAYWFISYRYYTMQTNLMVTIWWTLAIICHNKSDKLKKISGILKGALTLYITVTFLIFALLLSWLYTPTGYAAFTNLILHYITPIAFIIDWILTEKEVEYDWKYLLYFVSYPLGYLVFAVIHGTFTGDYLYYFFDINANGIFGFIGYVSFLVVFFILLGSLYIRVNRKRMKG